MNFIKNIISSFLGSLLAIVIGSFLMVVIFIATIAAFATQADTNSEVEYGKTNFLRISLNKQLAEYEETSPFEGLDLPYGVGKTGNIGLVQLLNTIEKATTDENIDGVYLNVTGIYGGYAQVKEIRDQLLKYKEVSGKPIYAYSEMLTEKGYYLASVANQVYLTPEGVLEFNGLSAEVMYYKQLFDRLEVKPRIFKVGKYKSAVEPYFRDSMSEANREQITSFIESMYVGVMKEISASRGVSYEELRGISDSMKVRNVYQAVEYKLVDGAMYYDEVVLKMKEDIGLAADADLTLISSSAYIAAELNDIGSKIGVVIAEGEIHSGKSSDGTLGASSFIKSLKEAREDDDVKAIVVRINSPGGSALASDVMWREIKVAASKKPVIASMSSVAASGGYYMAMACDEIVAEPLTVTGSIGVFGVMFTLDDFLEHKIGVTTDRVRTGQFSDLGSFTRELTEADSLIIQTEVERIYDVFTKKAADSRDMKQEKLQSLAGGRVYSGYEALDIGLVDTLGGLKVAIALAASKAELKNHSIKYFYGEENVWEKLAGSQTSIEENFVKEKLGVNYKAYKVLEMLERKKGVQALMPYELIVN